MTAGRATERGHSLLELTVVATLMGVMGIVFGLAGRYMSGETVRLRQRARVSSELHMAVEHLRQDLARAAKVGTRDGGGLIIEREAPIGGLEAARRDGADGTVEYVLRDDRLLRTGPDGDAVTVVALRIGSFAVEQPDGFQTRIHLAAGDGLLARSVTLVWEP